MAFRTRLISSSKGLLSQEIFGFSQISGHSLMCKRLRATSRSGLSFRWSGTGPCSLQALHYSVSVNPAATKKDSNAQSRSVDSLPPDPNNPPVVIYEGILKAQIRSVKLFSITTSVMGLALQPMILEKLGTSSIGALVAVFGMVGFFTYVTPFLIHYMAKRYVTDVTHDPANDVYTAATYSFFLQRKELTFQVEDIIVPEIPGPFTTIIVKKENNKFPLFLADTAFIDPKHFGRFMGYDKPIDFKLNITLDDVEAAMKQKKSVEVKNTK